RERLVRRAAVDLVRRTRRARAAAAARPRAQRRRDQRRLARRDCVRGDGGAPRRRRLGPPRSHLAAPPRRRRRGRLFRALHRARRALGDLRRGDRRLQLLARRVLGAVDVTRVGRGGRTRARLRVWLRDHQPRMGPGPGRGERGRRPTRGRDVRRGRLPRARLAVRAYARRAVEIRKVLVANRGEIALRIFRTCREHGIGTVAVVAPDDRGSLHARSADETIEIAGYLHSEEHLRAARETGADAIHPGYGFLAESAAFAEAVDAAALVWIGPSANALHSGGDKLEA